jgi:osmotically-inducible protein OsmY
MKRLTLSLLCVSALALPAFAADQSKTDKAAKQSDTSSSAAADNTDKNERDRSGETKTSGDQSESPEDIKITAGIRRAVVADKSLSMTAKNVKIITAEGVVTLRGPVNTDAEKTKIAELAKKNAGKAKVDNQLEVKKSN